MATWGITNLLIGNAYGEYTYTQDKAKNITILKAYTKIYCNGQSAGSLGITGRIQIGGSFYSQAKSINLSSAGTTTLVSKEHTIYHNPDGSVPTGWGLQFSITADGSSNYSQHKTLDQIIPAIPRPSVIAVENFTIDKSEGVSEDIPITVTQYVTSYTSKLSIKVLGTEVKSIDNPETGNITFTDTELQSIYNLMSEVVETDFTFTLTTYNGTTVVGTSEVVKKGTLSNNDLLPTFNNFVYSDNNPDTYNLTGNRYTLVKGHSSPTITVAGSNQAVAHKGATIKKYTFICGDQSKDYVLGEYPAYVQLDNVKDRVMTVWAIDSRGQSTKVDKLATNWIEYTNIEKIPFVAERQNGGTASTVKLILKGKVFDGSFGSVTNDITSATYKYKKTTDGEDEWVNGTTTLAVTKSGSEYSLEQLIAGDLGATGFDQEESFDIYVEVKDKLSKVSDTFTLGAGSPATAIYKNCVALGSPYDETIGGRVQIPKVAGETDFETNLKKQGKEVATLEDIKDTWQGLTVTDLGNANITVHSFKTNGKRVILDINVSVKSTLTVGNTLEILTIPSEHIPKYMVSTFAFASSTFGVMYIERNSNVAKLRNLGGNWSTNNGLNISLTWDLF